MREMRSAVLAVAVTLVLCATARADLPIPGRRSIDHTFEVTGLDRAPAGTVFVLAPLHLGMGHEVVGPGVSFTYRAKYATPNLYALSGDVDLAILDPKALEESPAPRAVDPFPVVSNVRTASLVERMHSVYEFRGIRDGRIELMHVNTTRFDGQGTEVSDSGWSWPPIVLSALALAALLFLGVRRLRAGKREH